MGVPVTARNRWLTPLLFLVLAAVLVVVAVPIPLSGDFVAYWAASRMTLENQDAYNVEAIHQVELATGRGYPFSVTVENPPWTPALLLPFGALPFAWARSLWLVCSIGFLVASGYWLGALYWPQATARERLGAVVLPLLFVHSLLALYQGQINVLSLFGVTGSLFFFGSHPALSGLLLVLPTVKPHICLGGLILLTVWAMWERRWRFFGGAIAFLGVLMVILTGLRPRWPIDFQRVLNTPLLAYRSPTLATWVREQVPGIPTDYLFPAIMLVLVGALAVWAARTNRWREGVAHSIVITMLFTTFGWSYDQISLLIPTYYLLGRARATPRLTWGLVLGLLAINGVAAGIRMAGSTDDFHYFWVAPAFAILYGIGLASTRSAVPALREATYPITVQKG